MCVCVWGGGGIVRVDMYMMAVFPLMALKCLFTGEEMMKLFSFFFFSFFFPGLQSRVL